MSQPTLPSSEKILAALREARTKIEALEQRQHEPIAVVGMGCRFPGNVNTPEEFWRLLQDGVDAIREVPPDRWDVDAYYDPDPEAHGKMYTRQGGFLEQVDHFDASFFGLSPREVVSMDPQQRLLLEVSWEAFEHANLAPTTLFDSATGVFVGICGSDYGALLTDEELAYTQHGIYALTGNALSVAAGRIAYTLGLTGPCVAIDTACSSSLVAVHQACHSLRQRECTVALAGGVHIMLRPDTAVAFSRGRALSPDGRCKAFDAGANGYTRSEGCGMVVLKRLSTAQADGDPILAVIRGSMINQDGRSSGLTVPSGPSQQRVIRQALANAKVDPAQVGYIEAHGTGTSLGDPIEIGAINAVFSGRAEPLWVGSAKTNLGHLEAAAGIAGLMKVILAMQYGEIPRHLHFHQPNPYIDWDGSPVRIPVAPTPWPVLGAEGRRIAGVSSFGFSGTNAHVVVEGVTGTQSPAASQGQAAEQPTAHLLPLAAKSEEALRALAQRYTDLLQAKPTLDLANLCAAAQVGRSHFDYRVGVVATSVAQLQERLTAFQQGATPTGVVHGRMNSRAADAPIAFLFTGQGAQYVNMGRDLYATQPLFRQIIDQCDELLRPYLPQSLVRVLYPTEEGKTEARGGEAGAGDGGLLDQMLYAQPAVFAVEYALAKLWQSWGIQPTVVIGHSLGEFAAACFAGVFSLADGLKLVAARGRLLQSLPPMGEMVSVIATEAEMQALLTAHPAVAIGAINAPTSIVLSGYRTALQPVIAQLHAQGKKHKPLNIPIAAHSPQTEAILDDFAQVARSITLAPPTLSLVSSMTGQGVTQEVTDPTYWRRHLRQPVRFADGMQTLQAHGCRIFMEIGPQATLLSMAMQCWDAQQWTKPSLAAPEEEPQAAAEAGQPAWLASLHPARGDWQQMLESLGGLYVNSVPIDWAGFEGAPQARRKLVLPTYPFQRQRYWVDTTSKAVPSKVDSTAVRPLLHKMTRLPLHQEVVFETTFSVETLPFLADHRVYDTMVAPGACHLAMILSAADVLWQNQPCLVEDLLFPAALAVPPETERTVQLIWKRETATNGESGAGAQATVQLISFDQISAGEPAVHATGRVTISLPIVNITPLAEVRRRCGANVAPATLYNALERQHIVLGPSFQWLTEVWSGQGEAVSRLTRPDASDPAGHLLHPGLLDGCFQTAAMLHPATQGEETLLPFAVQRCQLLSPAQSHPTNREWWCHARQSGDQRWDMTLYDGSGQALAVIDGFEVRAIPAARTGAEPWREWLYTVEWQPQPLPTLNSLPATTFTNGKTNGHPNGHTNGHSPTDMAPLPTPQPQPQPLQNQCWLLFADETGAAAALAPHLQRLGAKPILVYSGAGYQQVDAQTFTLQADAIADYQRLLATLPSVAGVIQLWGMDETPLRPDLDLVQMARRGCGGVLALVQALAHYQPPANGLWLVTRGAQAVAPADRVPNFAQATLWGMGNVIALEHPELHCVRIDLDAAATPPAQATTLLAELLRNHPTDTAREDQIALRHPPQQHEQAGVAPQRYVARLARLHVPSTPALTIDHNGSYLITGGLGGLGLLTAEWLVEQGARHLVLVGRSQPKPAAQQKLAALQQQGVAVTIAQADVAQHSQLAPVLAAIDPHHPLRGVIHSVGVLADGSLLQQSWANFAQVLAPKLQGAWNLHHLTQPADGQPPLDFFVLYASAAGLLGNWGQANHAAANAFLDSFAHYRRAMGAPAVSIDWGAWAEVGAAAAMSERNRQQLAERGSGFIAPAEGLAALRAILKQETAQIGVAPITWERYLPQLVTAPPFLRHFAEQTPPQPATEKRVLETGGAFRQQLTAAPVRNRRKLLMTHLQSQVAAVLGMTQPPATKAGFTDLGMDSMMTIELKKRLEKSLQISLPATVVFEYATIEALGAYLHDEVVAIAVEQPEPAAAVDVPVTEAHTQPPITADTEAGPVDEAALDALSLDELAQLLSEKLEDVE
ncbi:MAG: type I polyketide synthase [Caldilineaceae bacterium]